MRKFTKLLLTLAMLFGAVGVNSVKAISLGDEITSLPGITDGTKFIISDNGTKAKYFYGTSSNDGGNENKNAELASIPADAYFYFTLEAYTGDDIENAYWIKITNADGEGYPYGSDGASYYYLNAVLVYTDVVISGTKNGWGGNKKDALWYVTYDAENGFSFQNVYRADAGSKSWLAIGNNFETSQQYLKLYSAPTDPLADYKAALSAKIARANMYNGVAYTTASFEALTAEITTAQAALAAAASAESLTTATTNLQAKIDALVFAEGYENLTAAMFKAWDKADAADAVSTGTANCTYNLFTATDLPYGESSVGYLHYADLSSYDKLIVVATAKRPRIMMNRDVNEGQWSETESDSHLIDNTKGGWSAKYFSNENNVYTADLAKLVADKGFAHLNAIKVEGWQVTDVITGMYLYKAPDPLAPLKEVLSEKIALAQMYNGLAYSETSFTALTSEIKAAEGALNNAEATEESLTTAKDNLQAKIEALTFKEGYENLTAAMFKAWNKADAADAVSTGTAGCTINMFTSTDLPYGEGGVSYLHYADLSSYEQLIIVTTAGTPRVMMNRVVDGGQDNANEDESKMLDMPKYDWTKDYYSNVNNVFTVDLALITKEKGFAHLNTIKDYNWGKVTVTGMYLYKTPDPLGEYKDALKDKITEANAINTFGKSAESIATLTQAINNGNVALVNANATQESLESATAAIDDAIAGLVLADGYTNLKQNMFMTYASVDDPGDGTKPGVDCAYVIHEATGQPYGDAGVTEFKWVDLAGYDKLYIVTMGTVKPRIMFNRLVANGNQAETQADSKMIDINPNNAYTWSTEKYQTINGNVYEIDLNAIRKDYGFVRLHAIKGSNYSNSLYVTDMLLYKSDEDVAVKVSSAGWTSFSSDKNVTVPDGITAYAASYDGTYVDLQPVTEVPAGNAVLIEGEIGTYRLPVVANATTIENNDLFVSDGTVTGESGSIYALSNGSHGVGFYNVGASVIVPAGKAYLVIENDIIATREFVGIGGATAIREVQTEESADNSLYNLAGQRVVKAQKGLFIQNGKKFFVK